MIKTRIIGVVLVKNQVAVQSIGFKTFLPIGDPCIAIDYLNRWHIDEIIVVNIDRNKKQTFSSEQIREFAKSCRTPLAIGGKIFSLCDITRIIQAGADKVVINSALATNPKLIYDAAIKFGSQSVIVSIDAYKDKTNYHTVYNNGESALTSHPSLKAAEANQLGAGEIFLTSINQDGRKSGYDLTLIDSVQKAVDIPVIASGGMGKPEHMYQVIKKYGTAVAAANYFHYSEQSVITLKRYLNEKLTSIRLDSVINYENHTINQAGRVVKLPEAKLDELRFIRI